MWLSFQTCRDVEAVINYQHRVLLCWVLRKTFCSAIVGRDILIYFNFYHIIQENVKMYKTPIVIAIHQIRFTLLHHLSNHRKAEASGNKQVYSGSTLRKKECFSFSNSYLPGFSIASVGGNRVEENRGRKPFSGQGLHLQGTVSPSSASWIWTWGSVGNLCFFSSDKYGPLSTWVSELRRTWGRLF